MSAPTAIPVRVEPLGIILHCSPNETLIRCAWRSGYYWPTICGGIGDCGACRCELAEGDHHADPLLSKPAPSAKQIAEAEYDPANEEVYVVFQDGTKEQVKL